MERFAGRYAVLRRLGQGGLGAVHLALDTVTGRECALKRLAPSGGGPVPELLRHEFDVLARVRHPAIVSVLDFGVGPDGSPYYTMEFVPGVPADRALVEGGWRSLARFAIDVTRGLEALHAAGIVHGDLKPSNVLVLPGATPGEEPRSVKLVDFGLAALLGRGGEGHRGTPGFAAPEVVRGEAPGVAADLYGLGATLYALATGRAAFAATASRSTLRRQQSGPPPALPLEEAGLPPALAELVLRLMAGAASERPRHAREVRLELERLAPGARRPLAERMRAEVLVGREREMARLERWLAMAPRGPSTLLLRGDAGVGTSALLAALAHRAALAGRTVVRLACGEHTAPGALMDALGARLAAAARGEAGAEEPALVAAAGESAEAFASRWADAAAAWIATLAREGPAPVLLLDEAAALDAISRPALRRLALHPGAAAGRWVWAGRGGAFDLDGADGALRASGQVDALVLAPLAANDIERLLATRLQEPPPAELVEWTRQRSAGHPGLALELVRAAAERGALRETEFGLTFDAAASAAHELPPDFVSSVLARLDACPEGARRLASALAVAGGSRSPATLRALDPAITPADEASLVEAGLAVRAADGALALWPPSLAPAHLARLEASERSTLHRAALAALPLSDAERFAHLSAAGNVPGALAAAEAALATAGDLALTLAAASLAAGQAPAVAARWAERAARAWLAAGRHREALEPARRALELEPASGERPARWLLLSSATLRAGSAADMEQLVAAALAEAPPQATRALLIANAASQRLTRGDREGAAGLARDALAQADAAADGAATGVAALTLGGVLLPMRPRAEIEDLARRSDAGFALAGDAGGRARALGLRALAAQLAGDGAAAELAYGQGLELARTHGARVAQEELLVNLALLLVETGRWGEAAAAYDEVMRIALEDGRSRSAALALANLAQLDGLSGRTASAARRARAAVRMARRVAPLFEGFAWRTLALARRIRGHARGAALAIARALALAERAGVASERDWCRVEFALGAIASGRWASAHAVCTRALGPGPEDRGGAGVVLAALAGRGALRRGDITEAARWLVDAASAASTARMPYARAHVQQLRAELALAQGRPAEAASLAREVLAGFAALPAPADRAQAALAFARLAIADGRGTTAPVADWLREAAGAFERLGDHRGRERALALLVDWLERTSRPGPGGQRDRTLLESVSRLLDSLSDPAELARRAMQLAVEHLDAERGVLILADPETGALDAVVEHGAIDAEARDHALGYSRRVVERVASGGASLLITDAPSHPDVRSASVLDLGLRSILCVPMYADGRVLGAVYLDDSRRPGTFSDDDRGLLEGFAHLMAVSIEKSRGHEETRRANERLVDENLSLRREASVRFQPQNFVGASAAMQRVLGSVERAAQTSSTVLVTGENGTGKELIARILHHGGRRKLAPFVAVNCGAIPETLLESELFGILPNVATGVRGRPGRFEQANGGTLFLDEIGDMPLDQQVALLSVLTRREITPVGGTRAIPVDVRIIAATNRDLARMVEEGRFREDLFYRLNVIPIDMPPLRERKSDIPAMAHFFAAQFALQQERPVPELAPEFIAALMQSDWPGNVREMQNYVERIMAMTPGPVLRPDPLPRDLQGRPARQRFSRSVSLAERVADLEQRSIREALERCGGNQAGAARELGMTEQSLRYRLRKYATPSIRRNRRTRRNRRQ